MKEWMQMIPPQERAFYEKAGFGAKLDFGSNPALVVIDVTLGFCGSPGLTLDQAVAEFNTACGPVSWTAMPKIAALIDIFRTRELPIVFTQADLYDQSFTGKATKSTRKAAPDPRFGTFPEAIKPRDTEWVLTKTRASAFFQTPLSAYLIKQGIDTVVLCGTSTSGCVRASTVDALSHGFNAVVVDDCCFDRSQFAHAANLFDMAAKYASVVSLDELAAMMPLPTLARAS